VVERHVKAALLKMGLNLSHCDQSKNSTTGLKENSYCCGFSRSPTFCPSMIHDHSPIKIEGQMLNLTYGKPFLAEMKLHGQCLLFLKNPPSPPAHPACTPTTMCTCLESIIRLSRAEKDLKTGNFMALERKRAAAQMDDQEQDYFD
jgi:hypothetical protein